MACGEEPAVACDGFPDDIVEAAGGDEKILVNFIGAGIIKGLFHGIFHGFRFPEHFAEEGGFLASLRYFPRAHEIDGRERRLHLMYPAFDILPIVLLLLLQRVDGFYDRTVGDAQGTAVQPVCEQRGFFHDLSDEVGLIQLFQLQEQLIKINFFPVKVDSAIKEDKKCHQSGKKKGVIRRIAGNAQKTEEKKQKGAVKTKKKDFILHIIFKPHI